LGVKYRDKKSCQYLFVRFRAPLPMDATGSIEPTSEPCRPTGK
jgi:hypothetical protein